MKLIKFKKIEKKLKNNLNILINQNSDINNETVFLAILPNNKFVSKDFDNTKKIKYAINNSTTGFNSIKVIDKEKIYKNLKIKINIEYSMNKETKMDNIQLNTDYKLSEINTFIKKITISTDFGKIKIENLFTSEIEILLN